MAIILSEAEAEASRIRAQGGAAAVDVFIEALSQEPELSPYRPSLDAYKVSGALPAG